MIHLQYLNKKINYHLFFVAWMMIKMMNPNTATMKITAMIFNLQFLQYNILSSLSEFLSN